MEVVLKFVKSTTSKWKPGIKLYFFNIDRQHNNDNFDKLVIVMNRIADDGKKCNVKPDAKDDRNRLFMSFIDSYGSLEHLERERYYRVKLRTMDTGEYVNVRWRGNFEDVTNKVKKNEFDRYFSDLL